MPGAAPGDGIAAPGPFEEQGDHRGDPGRSRGALRGGEPVRAQADGDYRRTLALLDAHPKRKTPGSLSARGFFHFPLTSSSPTLRAGEPTAPKKRRSSPTRSTPRK